MLSGHRELQKRGSGFRRTERRRGRCYTAKVNLCLRRGACLSGNAWPVARRNKIRLYKALQKRERRSICTHDQTLYHGQAKAEDLRHSLSHHPQNGCNTGLKGAFAHVVVFCSSVFRQHFCHTAPQNLYWCPANTWCCIANPKITPDDLLCNTSLLEWLLYPDPLGAYLDHCPPSEQPFPWR